MASLLQWIFTADQRKRLRRARAVALVVILSPAAASALWTLYRQLRAPLPTRLLYADTEENRRKLAQCRLLRSYKPTSWLWNGHMQTLFAVAVRRLPAGLTYQRELLDLTDGAKVALDWAGAVRKGAPTLVLLHGLTGGSQEAYIQWIVEAARQRGIQSVVFNARGCGGSRLYTPLGFNAARTVDLHEVVQHVQVCVGEDTPLFAVGVSLGAGILVKYLGEMGSGAPFRAAVALCATFDFLLTAKRLEERLTKLTYNRALARNLCAWLRRQEEQLKGVVDVAHVYRARTIREFDERVVVPVFGYRDVWAYYTESSPRQYLPTVAVPLLCLNAADDPIASVEGVPEDVPLRNPNVVVAITSEGGHVAWCSGAAPLGNYWVDDVTVEWLQQHL